MSSSAPTLRWGIISTGFIAKQFVDDITHQNGQSESSTPYFPKANHIIQAVGASSSSKAKDFISEHVNNQKETPTVGSYDDVINDKNVDILYIGLPHTSHYDITIQGLNAGKHVLCEKPITVNYQQAKDLFDLAREKNLYLMEAQWTRFFPLVHEIQDHIFKKKTIGDVSRLTVDYGNDMKLHELGPESRLKNPEFAGGAVLDIGIYTILYWRLFLDESRKPGDATPHEIKSFQVIRDGIDVQSDILIKQKDGKVAVLSSTFLNNSDEYLAKVSGDKGVIYIGSENRQASRPTKFKIVFKDENKKPIEKSYGPNAPNGLIYEANAVAKDISEGKIFNDIVPPEETYLVIKTIDTVREQNGLSFPNIKYEKGT